MTLVFPHPKLTIIKGEPTYHTVRKLRSELYCNARAIHSDRGGGQFGYLGIIMDRASYVELAEVPFILPSHPGSLANVPQGATAEQREEIIRAHKAALDEFREANAVLLSLKSQILAAVDHVFLEPLDDHIMGFADATPEALLKYLMTYFRPTREQVSTNLATLNNVYWDPKTPIETLFKRISKIMKLAEDAYEPISDEYAIYRTLFMFERCGTFRNECATWRRQDVSNQTMANFREHFTQAGQLMNRWN